MNILTPPNFNHLIILTRNPKLPSIEALVSMAKTSGLEVHTIDPFTSLEFPSSLQNFSDTIILPRTSGISFDDIDLTYCDELVSLGAYCPIATESIRKLRDKDRQYTFLKNLGLPLLKTYVIRGKLREELFPKNREWIIKSIRGNKGIGIEKLNTEELSAFWQKAYERRDQRYLIQDFIADADEVRVLCLGNKLWTIGKKSEGSHWKKNSQYAKFSSYQLSTKEASFFKGHAQIIKENLNLPAFAIDYIRNEAWEILEVNIHPGLEASSEALGLNLYPHYWNALFSKRTKPLQAWEVSPPLSWAE